MGRARKAWTDKLAGSSIQLPLFAPPPQPKRRTASSMKPPDPLEGELQKLILEFTQLHPLVAKARRANTGAGRFINPETGRPGRFVRYGEPGQSDIIGMMKGGAMVLAIEVKTPRTKANLSPLQRAYLLEVRAAGGLSGVAWDIESARAIIEGKQPSLPEKKPRKIQTGRVNESKARADRVKKNAASTGGTPTIRPICNTEKRGE